MAIKQDTKMIKAHQVDVYIFCISNDKLLLNYIDMIIRKEV